MIAPLPRLPVSKSLRAGIAEATTYPCELSAIPRAKGADGQMIAAKPPFTILYPLEADRAGSYGAPSSDATWAYQATLVAARGDQLEWLYDRLVGFVLARTAEGGWVHPLEVEGMSIYHRSIGVENGGESSQEDAKGGIMSYDVRFSISATPKVTS